MQLPLAKPVYLDPESNNWWWNPSRPGVRQCPEWFASKLAEIDPDVRVTWNAYRERWQVWAPKPSLRNPISQGWLFLFPVQYDDGSYAPLDERTLSKLYQVSSRVWGNAKSYFDRIADEKARDKEKFLAKRRQSIADGAGEYFDFTQPKISMCGPSSGSKCAQLDED